MRKHTMKNMRRMMSLLLVLVVLATCVLPNFAVLSVKAEGTTIREQIQSLEGITIDEYGNVTREETAELLTIDANHITSETDTAYVTDDGLTIQKADVTQETVNAYEAKKQQEEQQAQEEAQRQLEEQQAQEEAQRQLEEQQAQEAQKQQEEQQAQAVQQSENSNTSNSSDSNEQNNTQDSQAAVTESTTQAAAEATTAYELSDEEIEEYEEYLSKMEQEINDILSDDDEEAEEETTEAEEETEEVAEETTTEAAEENTQAVRRSLKAPAVNANGAEDSTEESDEESNSVSTDLKDYLTKVTFQIVQNGKWVDLTEDTTITNNDSVQAKLEWTISPSAYAANSSKTYTYQLPDGFTIGQATSGDVQGTNGETVGTFKITSSGLVTVTYNSDYNEDNNEVNSWMNIRATASLSDIGDGDKIIFNWDEGSTEITVVTDGDFTVKKEASKLTTEMSDDSVIEYTVTIDSEGGTKDNITITDVLSTRGTDVFESVAYDASSFSLVRSDGTKIDLSDILTIDSSNNTFTITDVPALGKGENYKLTYRVNVTTKVTEVTLSTGEKVKESAVVNGNVDNTVTAAVGDSSRTDKVNVSYPLKIKKNSGTYSSTNKRMEWSVYVYTTSGQSVAGYTFTDTASQKLKKNSDGTYYVKIKAINSKDGIIAQYDATKYNFTISEDEKTFSFVFPEEPSGTVRWKVEYYTEAELEEGASQIEVDNRATIKAPNSKGEWSSANTGIGTPWTSTVSKKSEAVSETPDENGIVTLTWSFTADFEDAIVTNSSNSVYVADDIQDATRVRDGATFKELHYSYRTTLTEDLDANLRITIEENGVDTEYTVAEAKAAGYKVEYYFYNVNWTNVNNISGVDKDKVKIKYYIIRIYRGSNAQVHVKNISVSSYRTFFDTTSSEYTIGELWTFKNRVRTSDKNSTVTAHYAQSQGTIVKEIGIPSKKTHDSYKIPTKWQTGGADLNYDYTAMLLKDPETGEMTEKAVVYYRVLIEADEKGDIELTDKLPDGLKLAALIAMEMAGLSVEAGTTIALPMWDSGNGFFDIGPYNGENVYIGEDIGWSVGNLKEGGSAINNDYDGDRSYNNNLSITLNEDGSFTLNIKNRGEIGPSGNKLYQADSKTGQIAVYYAAYVDDWDALKKYTGQSESGQAEEVVNLQNTATWTDHGSSSVDADIIRDRTILDKSGEQVTDENGTLKSEASYQIKINEPATDFLADSNVLTFTDTIRSSTLKYLLDRDSIKLYEMNKDGTKGAEVAISNIQISDVTEEGGEYVQTITMQIEDGKAYILEYVYSITEVIGSGSSGTLDNRAEIEGIAYDDSKVEEKSIIADAGASTKGKLKLYKVDEENVLLYLDGAEFTLYKYNGSAFEKVTDFTITDGKTGYEFKYGTTTGTLQENTLYKIVETKAPTDYIIGDDHYFIIKGTGDDNEVLTDEAALQKTLGSATTVGGVNISTVDLHYFKNDADTMYIGNEKETVDVEVTKTWADNLKDEKQSVQVTLKKDGKDLETVTLSEANSWYYKWTKLDKDAKYSVEEIIPDDKKNIWKDPVITKDETSVIVSNPTQYTVSSNRTMTATNGASTEGSLWSLCINETAKDPGTVGSTKFTYTRYENTTYDKVQELIDGTSLSTDDYMRLKRMMYYYIINYESKASGVVFDCFQRVAWSITNPKEDYGKNMASYLEDTGTTNGRMAEFYMVSMGYDPSYLTSGDVSRKDLVDLYNGTKILDSKYAYSVSDATINSELVIVAYETTDTYEGQKVQNLLSAKIGTAISGERTTYSFNITNEKKFLAVLPETGSRAWKSLLGLGIISALAAGLWLAYRNKKIFLDLMR